MEKEIQYPLGVILAETIFFGIVLQFQILGY